MILNTPLQAQLCQVGYHSPSSSANGRSKGQPDQKLSKLVGSQGFHEDVDHLKIGDDMSKIDIPYNDPFPNEVVVHLNVLCLSVEDMVSSKMDTSEIVAAEQDWIIDGDVQILT